MKTVYCDFIELLGYTTGNDSKRKDLKPESKNNKMYPSDNDRNFQPTAATQQTKNSKSGNKIANSLSKLSFVADTLTFTGFLKIDGI